MVEKSKKEGKILYTLLKNNKIFGGTCKLERWRGGGCILWSKSGKIPTLFDRQKKLSLITDFKVGKTIFTESNPLTHSCYNGEHN